MATKHYFIGIDISKATLDCTILKDGNFLVHQKIKNTIEEVKAWLKEITKEHLIKRSNSIFCMESMGIYGSFLVNQLIRTKANFWIESPLRIKRSLGLQRGKNDKVDSLRIAQYCFTNQTRFSLYQKPRTEIEQLKLLNALRHRIITAHVQLSLSIREGSSYLNRNTTKTISQLCGQSLSSLKEDRIATELAMEETIKADENLYRLFKILTSIHCVGKISAIEFLISTNEFKKFDSPKKFACYCGVAPFEHSSGTSTKGKTRVSRIANRKMKTVLHMCAVTAIRWNGELNDFFKKKVAEGKPKLSVLNAVRNKIIHRIFACVREDRLYERIKL